jgi:hypothetical protein
MVKLEEMFKGHDKTPEMILSEMVDPHNIEMKTEISQPINLAKLYVISQCLKDDNCVPAGKRIEEFIDRYLLYQVSYNRQSRKEVIEALIARMNIPKEEQVIVP